MCRYKYVHREELSSSGVASLLGTTLFNRRFFPYYAFNILGCLDEEGHGVVYSYDAVGSYECLKYGVQGSAQSHIIPILDSCVAKRNRNVPYVDLEKEEALNLLKEVFTAATEVCVVWLCRMIEREGHWRRCGHSDSDERGRGETDVAAS